MNRLENVFFLNSFYRSDLRENGHQHLFSVSIVSHFSRINEILWPTRRINYFHIFVNTHDIYFFDET